MLADLALDEDQALALLRVKPVAAGLPMLEEDGRGLYTRDREVVR